MFDSKLKAKISGLEQSLGKADIKIDNLEKENALIRSTLENMSEGVISLGRKAGIIYLNPGIEKIFGITKERAEGKFFLEVIPNNDILEIVNNVLETGNLISKELSLVWPLEKVFHVNASPVFEKNVVCGCLVVLHDITELKRLEKVRSDFVANVSHEIKTPLTSIKGFVETLLEGALEDKNNSRHFLGIIQDHANRLDNLVNDLLSLSYLESKEIILEKQNIDLNALLNDILSGFKSQFRKKSIESNNELSSGLLVMADKDKLGQVFTNLIDNAVKFNREKGFIRIYSEEKGDKVKITVEDNGLGIPAKDIPRIFERFYRVDKARSREMGGTGLGLSIVKHIIELHNGTVGVKSTEGLGSKFWFTLPV